MKDNEKKTSQSIVLNNGQRTIWVDCVAGLLVLRMILGHYVSYSGLKDSFLFSSLNVLFFYMPWFFFKSGMFFRPIEKEMWVLQLRKKVKSLVIPYLIFSLFGVLVGYTYFRVSGDANYCIELSSVISNFVGMGAFYWSSHLWFLLSLFVVLIITPPY